jgi:hypothetical protein
MDGSFEAPRLLEEFHALLRFQVLRQRCQASELSKKGEYLLNPFRIGQLDENQSPSGPEKR